MSTPQTPKFILRRFLLRSARRLLRARSTPYQARAKGPALVIAPHPDDESFGCGGWIVLQRAAGRDIHVLFLTDGEASHPGHPNFTSHEIKLLRAVEAKMAASALGLSADHLHFFGLPDGELDALEPSIAQNACARLHAFIRKLAPAEILLPCHDDGSSEHEAAFRLVTAPLTGMSDAPRILEFPVWSWWSPRLTWRLALAKGRVYHCLFPRQLSAKLTALACYRSQTEPLPPWTAPVLPEGYATAFHAPEEFFFENKC